MTILLYALALVGVASVFWGGYLVGRSRGKRLGKVETVQRIVDGAIAEERAAWAPLRNANVVPGVAVGLARETVDAGEFVAADLDSPSGYSVQCGDETPVPLEFSLDGEPVTPLPFTAPPDGVTRDGLAAAVAEGRRQRARAEAAAQHESPVHAARKGGHR